MTAFLAGFLGFLGLILPHFARSFDLGVHNRILGWCCLGAAMFAAAPRFSFARANCRDALLWLGLLVLVLGYSTWDQIAEVGHVPTRLRYYEEKTAITVQFWMPVLAAGFVLSSMRGLPGFWSGARAAFLACGVVAIAIMVLRRDLFVAATVWERVELVESRTITITGFSAILCCATLALLASLKSLRTWPAVAVAALVVPLIAAVIMVQQRAHLVAVLGIGAVWLAAGRRKWIALVIAAVGFAGWQWSDAVMGQSVVSYWDDLVHGDAAAVRLDALRFAANGFRENPLGAGYGSFALECPGERLIYPHNIAAETGYELGLIGLAAVAALGVACLRRFWAGLSGGWHGRLASGLLLFAFLHSMKSGDLAGAELLGFFLLVSRAAKPRSGLASDPGAALAGHGANLPPSTKPKPCSSVP